MEVRKHSDGYILTKWFGRTSNAVNRMVIDRKEAEAIVKQLEKLLKPKENI